MKRSHHFTISGTLLILFFYRTILTYQAIVIAPVIDCPLPGGSIAAPLNTKSVMEHGILRTLGKTREFMKLSPDEINQLITAARAAQQHAYAIHSHYHVGAALLTTDGQIISGCNVESQVYSLTCCAERVALFKAISQGHRHFKALAVITPDGQTPCGACRQLIRELCGDIAIIIVKPDGSYTLTDAATLLPAAWLR